MTDDEACELYFKLPGVSARRNYGEDEIASIANEMRAVVDAASDEDAGKVIAWWGCFGRTRGIWRTATATATAIRSRWHKMQEKAAA